MRHFELVGLVIALAFLPSSGRTQSATSGIFGSCNIANQNLALSQGASVTNYVDCGSGDGRPLYRVRYIWLDSGQVSFLLGNYIDPALGKLIGSVPKIHTNGVYTEIKKIMEVAAVRPSIGSRLLNLKYQTRFIGSRGETVAEQSSLSELRADTLRRIRIYAGDEPIIWFDVDASKTVRNSRAWPDNYKMTYGDERGDPRLFNEGMAGPIGVTPTQIPGLRPNRNADMARLFSCVILHRFVSRTEFDEYWNNVDLAEKAVMEKTLTGGMLVNPRFSGESLREASLVQEPQEAISLFTQKNWPDDFLIVVGKYSQDGCGGDQAFGFYAVPRKLFVLVAVLEPLAKDLEVSALDYLVDENVELRRVATPSINREESFRPFILRRGETLMVPLRIELRYSPDDFPTNYILRNSRSENYFNGIRRIKGDESVVKNGTDGFLRKNKESFLPPQYDPITRVYVFGSALEIASASLDGKKYLIQPPPASAALVSISAGENSCPHLYFREQDGGLSSFGKILIGAHAKAAAEKQTIFIDRRIRSILIAEKEPEITYVTRASLKDNRTGRVYQLANDVVIGPRRVLELIVPNDVSDEVELSVEGYYQTLIGQEQSAR